MFFQIYGQLLKGKSLLRSLMNYKLKDYELRGEVVDIGGGINPSYYQYLKIDKNAIIRSVDLVEGDDNRKIINLEKDPLPFNESSIDQVLLFNILEHIYNYQFLVGEARRILKEGGRAIGFVPFFINVHPDPHDFFRYTKEALELIFKEAKFKDQQIIIIGLGPFSINFNNIIFLFPRIVNIIIFPFYYFLDLIILKIRPRLTERFPLGYLFILTK